MKRILVITYWSVREPLIQNYTLPYLRLIRLFLAEGGRILLVTMEKEEEAYDGAGAEERATELLEEGIEWYPEPYRPFGLRAAWNWSALIRKWGKWGRKGGFDVVHAFGTPAGVPAYRISRKTGKPLIIDSFEPHAEPMLEVGQWRRNGSAFRTLFRMEKQQARAADAVIAASPSMKRYSWERYRALHPSFQVKPACVDRRELHGKAEEHRSLPPDLEGKVVGIYAGKFGGIYLEGETFDLIRAAWEEWGSDFFMILLTDLPEEKGRSWAARKGIPENVILQEWMEPEKVPAYLRVADFAINPVRPVPSKRHCTSIKDGEYWAMGLPVIIPEGVAEDARIIREEGIGVVLPDLSPASMRNGIKEMRNILEEPELPAIKERIGGVADRERGFDRALNVYRKVYGEVGYRDRPTTVLLLAYYRYDDPVFQSALLSYFEDFPEKERYRFILLTFEEDEMPEERVQELQDQLLEQELYWERIPSGKRGGRVGRKALDFLHGIRKGRRMIREQEVDVVYSEGFPSAIIGHHIARAGAIPHILHTYEPHAEYMREAGIWKENGPEYRITKRYERLLQDEATVLITGTKRMVEEVKQKGGRAEFLRIPSCVDLERFRYSPEDRTKLRNELGIPEEALLLVYLGKLGGMYYDRELFELFEQFREEAPERDSYFLILSGDDRSELRGHAEAVGLDPERIRILELSPEAVPAYLSAADMAFSGVQQTPSKRYCSPIKHGEYWACGLPVVIFRGVSEDDLLVEEHGGGVVVESPDPVDLNRAVRDALNLLEGDREALRQRCRELAEKERSLERAKALLKDTFDELVPGKAEGK